MRIGELSAATGVPPKTIRYYESIGVLQDATRLANGYRSYEDRDIDRLTFVKDAQAAGLTLDEIAEVLELKGQGQSTCTHVIETLEGRLKDITDRISRLEATRDELERMTARARRLDPTRCVDPDRCQTIDLRSSRRA